MSQDLKKYEVAKATMQNPQILSKCKNGYPHSITNIFITYNYVPIVLYIILKLVYCTLPSYFFCCHNMYGTV